VEAIEREKKMGEQKQEKKQNQKGLFVG